MIDGLVMIDWIEYDRLGCWSIKEEWSYGNMADIDLKLRLWIMLDDFILAVVAAMCLSTWCAPSDYSTKYSSNDVSWLQYLFHED